MTHYSIEPKTIKYVKGYGLLSFARKYKKQILEKGLMLPKKQFIKQVNIQEIKLQMQSNNDNIQKQEPVEEIITPSEKREEILNKLKKVL